MNVPGIDLSVLPNPMDPFIVDCLIEEPPVAGRIVAPECPVCYERFKGYENIFQCNQGHFVCQRCYHNVRSCPRCRGQMIGRAHDFEQFLQTLSI